MKIGDIPRTPTVLLATTFTALLLGVGYWSLGLATMLVFTTGFVTGVVFFVLRPATIGFVEIKWPYIVCLVLFVVHRVEEYLSGFFDALARLTGVDKPDVTSLPVVCLVALSVGAWLFVPVLAGRSRLGTYLAWTFFSALGITELAHVFVFPPIVGWPLQYFPGMASVFLLAPAAWWGLAKTWRATA